jgi:enoyl-CoA hydratase/carnithine racemase
MTDDQLVRVTVADHVATVALNRPEKLNAISRELSSQLATAFERIAVDPDVRVVVLTGEGRAFCAGADLTGGGMSSDPTQVLANYEATSARQLAIWNLPQPVIAAVNGYCLGRGMELALWCDVVIAASGASFGEPEVRDGSFVSSMIPRLTTPQRAKLLMLTGDRIDASTAYELGLVTQVAPGDDCLPAATALAGRLAHVPVATARAVKRYVNAVADGLSLGESQHYGNTMGALLRSLTHEQLGVAELVRVREEEGLKAYLAARDAPFAEVPQQASARTDLKEEATR